MNGRPSGHVNGRPSGLIQSVFAFLLYKATGRDLLDRRASGSRLSSTSVVSSTTQNDATVATCWTI